MARSPLVSVVMPVWHARLDYFGEAVESVLQQTLPDWELVIVEDPSPLSVAASVAQLQDGRLRLVRNAERTSLVAQLNRGLAEARGQLVARFDADDLCEPQRLDLQSQYLAEHPKIDVLGSQISIIDREGRLFANRRYPCAHEEIVAALRRYNPLAHPSVMCRRSVLADAGGYRQITYRGAEDYELWCRLAHQGKRFANHSRPLLRYRVQPGQSKARHTREQLLATLEVKRMHWSGQMDLRARCRYVGESLLRYVPARAIGLLFRATQFS